MMQPALLICFTGIDGSGKTTQAKLVDHWLASLGFRSIYIWSRGEVQTIRNILLFLGRKALGTSSREINNNITNYQIYQTRKSKLMRHPFVRWIWSAMTCVEHIIQINADIQRKIRAGWIVVCDRYMWDSNIDLAVLNNKDPAWLSGQLNIFLSRFIPKPTITFFIDIPPEEALQRKDDIPSYEYVMRRTEFYRYLAMRNSFIVIDGREDALMIQDKIRNIIAGYLPGKEKQ
jgi:thymidylate kinase